jgi:hypothetical protein
VEKPVAYRADPAARRAYSRWHYQQNKEVYKRRARRHTDASRQKVRAWLLDYLLSHPCVDCGESDPIVLEFDHREDVGKVFDIGSARRECVSLATVQVEVSKCDVRCANCHRRLTYRRAGRTHRDSGVAQSGSASAS